MKVGFGSKILLCKAGVPNQGYIFLHLRLAIEGKISLYVSYFKILMYTSVNIIFKNHYMLVVKYISFQTQKQSPPLSSNNPKILLKIQWIFVILLRLFVIRNFRGT